MKTVFISFNQAHYERIVKEMTHINIKGFTAWREIKGRGSHQGEAHYGTQAWPTLNDAMLVVIEETKLSTFLDILKQIDSESPELGLRAFVWNVEQTI